MDNIKIIAVCGGSGSGKSTIVNMLAERFGPERAVVLGMDHYYKDLSSMTPADRKEVNFDSPDALDLSQLAEHLRSLKKRSTVQRPNYCFKTHTRLPETTEFLPKQFVIVDGILSTQNEEVKACLDYSVFVDVDADLRFIRRMLRDQKERGRSIDSIVGQYLGTVRKMYNEFVAPQKSHVDFIVDWTDYNVARVEELISALELLP